MKKSNTSSKHKDKSKRIQINGGREKERKIGIIIYSILQIGSLLVLLYVIFYRYSIGIKIKSNFSVDVTSFKMSMMFLLLGLVSFGFFVYEFDKNPNALSYPSLVNLMPFLIIFKLSGVITFALSFRKTSIPTSEITTIIVLYIVSFIFSIKNINVAIINYIYIGLLSSLFLMGVLIKQNGFIYL